MSKIAITSQELAPPVGPFSQAGEVGGFLYFSGQVAQDPAPCKLIEGGIVAETESVFQNLSEVLKAAGKRFDDVLRDGVFLANRSDFAAMNSIYSKHFSQPFPAQRSPPPCYHLGPTLRSISLSRPAAAHGGRNHEVRI